MAKPVDTETGPDATGITTVATKEEITLLGYMSSRKQYNGRARMEGRGHATYPSEQFGISSA